MVYQRGNQREGSPHYVLLYSDEENSGDEDAIPMQPCRRNATSPRKIEVINVPLKPDDTLQALALRYRCTISELKRINKIHKENEIHARRIIKVPVQPFSFLTETLQQGQNASEEEGGLHVASMEIPSTSTGRTEQSRDLASVPLTGEQSKTEINAIILNSVCEPLSTYNSSNSLEIPSTECDNLLSSMESNTTDPHLTDTFKCSGDDCGLSWTQLLGFSLLLGFAGPIIYILYIAEFSSKTHSTVSD